MSTMKKNQDGTVTVRIRESGQVLDLVPDVAREMLNSGYAEQSGLRGIDLGEKGDFTPAARNESTMGAPVAEHAVAPAQASPTRRPFFKKKR